MTWSFWVYVPSRLWIEDHGSEESDITLLAFPGCMAKYQELIASPTALVIASCGPGIGGSYILKGLGRLVSLGFCWFPVVLGIC